MRHTPTTATPRAHSAVPCREVLHRWAGSFLSDKAWPVLYDNGKVMSVAGKFECKVGMEEGMHFAAGHYRKRAAAYEPDLARHAFLDRVAEEQIRLGAKV